MSARITRVPLAPLEGITRTASQPARSFFMSVLDPRGQSSYSLKQSSGVVVRST